MKKNNKILSTKREIDLITEKRLLENEYGILKSNIVDRLSIQVKALEYISINPETTTKEYLTLFENIMFLLDIYPESENDILVFSTLVGDIESVLFSNKSLIAALKDSYVIDRYKDTPAWDKLQCVLSDLLSKGN